MKPGEGIGDLFQPAAPGEADALALFQPAGEEEGAPAEGAPDAACPLAHAQLHHLAGEQGKAPEKRGGLRFGVRWRAGEAWTWRSIPGDWEVWAWCGPSRQWLHSVRVEPAGAQPEPINGVREWAALEST